MNRILVITWFYPPVNSSEGIVTYKLLNNSVYKYDVFTQKNSASWSYGNEDYLKNGENINCIYAKSDNLKDWKKEAVEYFKNNKDKYDIVMTRSMPPESHEIGLKIKKIKPSIKLISSFGDPIANNPYEKIRKKQYSINHGYFKRNVYTVKSIIKNIYNKKVERKTIEKSSYTIFNSKEQKEYMIGDNKKGKYIILPHSYEEKLYDKSANKSNDKIVISYFGHLDEIRNAKIFLEALKDIVSSDKEIEKIIEINFYGNIGKNDIKYINENNLNNIVSYGLKINYLESLKKMQESNYLLFIDANISEIVDRNIFFAAKLADYIGSNTPIIGITMLDGVSADILRETNNLVLTYSKSDIKNYLLKIIKKTYEINNKKQYDYFNAKKVAKHFDEYIEKIIKEKEEDI